MIQLIFLNIKLKIFKNIFKDWGNGLFGHIEKRKNQLKSELKALKQCEGNMDLSREAELYKFYAHEESYWFKGRMNVGFFYGDKNIPPST